MTEPAEVHWASFPKGIKMLIWVGSVVIGGLLGLWLFSTQGERAITAFLACGFLPFLGSDLLIYGDMRFWIRPMDERHQARFLLTAFGFLLAIALVGAIGTYVLSWSDLVGPSGK